MPMRMGVGLLKLIFSAEKMRHEAAQIACNAARVLANTQPGGLMVHDPHAEDRVMSAKIRRCGERLKHVALFTVVAAGFFHHHAALDPRDVAAFTAQLRLADVAVAKRRGIFESREKIGMLWEKLPQNRQQALVAQ